jgi:hypothetical protein
MALWLAIQIIQIGIFDQLDQAYWLFSFKEKIQSFGRGRNVNVKGNASRGATNSVLSPTLFTMYINDTPQTRGVHLALFADDTCLYATDRKEGFAVRKLQRGLSSMDTWCERWNIKIN